jgi:hypothetical protein
MCNYYNISKSSLRSLEEAIRRNVGIDCVRFWYDSCWKERRVFCEGRDSGEGS